MSIPFIAAPLLLASLMPLIGKVSKRVLPDLLTNLTLAGLLAYAVLAGRAAILGGPDVWQASWMGQPLNITLVLDGFSLFMLATISLVTFCITLYCIRYLDHYDSRAIFYGLLLVMLAGMNGLVLADDLFTLYLFLEVAAVASYGLIAYGLGRDELEASFKYLMLSSVATAFILLSIAILFGLTGSLRLGDLASALSGFPDSGVVMACTALFLMGFGLKAALVPFHAWLPDAHSSAPAPISAMLSGVLIKVSGIYALTRVCWTVLGMTPALGQVLMALGLLSILAGAFLALGQNDIKRLLAYSSISQVGYIVLGIGVGTPLGLLGAIFHIFNHATAKSLLFLVSGSLEQATGTRQLDKMGGLANRMPVTAGASVVGSLSIAGVPPLAGFWSKLIILVALVASGQYLAAFLAVAAGILTLWYYLVIQRRAFFGLLNETWAQVREAPFWMQLSMVLLSAVCIAVGLLFPFMIRDWIQPASDALASGAAYAVQFLGY